MIVKEKLTFKPYQTAAIDWLVEQPIAALQGAISSGKTLISLAAIAYHFEYGTINRALIIAPPKVAKNTFPDELKKWDVFQHLNWVVLFGNDKDEELRRPGRQIHIMPYSQLEWLASSGMADQYDMIVVDESHNFKTQNSVRFRALKSFIFQIPIRVIMTGSVTGNSLTTIWPQYFLLDAGERLFRAERAFLAYWFWQSGKNFWSTWRPRNRAAEEISDRIADITYRIENHEVVRPDLKERVIKVELPDSVRDIYADLETEFYHELKTGDSISAIYDGSLSMKLRHLSSGFSYTDDGLTLFHESHKMDTVRRIVAEASCPVMIIANFHAEFRALKAEFPHAGMMCGLVTPSEAQRAFERWVAGNLDVLLLHPKSGGEGLNLQSGGHRMIWFSPDWSIISKEQTIGRLWRTGQAEGVVVDWMITAGTIEEVIYAAVKKNIQSREEFIQLVKRHYKSPARKKLVNL